MTAETYNVVSIVLISLTLVAGIVTVIVYYRQLQTMQATLKAQNLTGLIQYLQAPDVRKARHVVLTDLKNKPFSEWSDCERENAATACAAYGVAGVLVELGRVDRGVIFENWGQSIRGVCDTCKEFIENQQRQLDDQNYCRALLRLYEEAKK